MKSSSTYKLLFLLNILSKNCLTKKQIIEEFEKNNLKITKSLITNYIDKITKSGINIEVKTNNKREKVYFFKGDSAVLCLHKKELAAISDLKKILICQKDYQKIKKTMRLFYRLAKHIKDNDAKSDFINFGYYSTINWALVKTLEKHCKNKDIITIDYILPNGTNRYITIHADEIKVSEWSERMYLRGILDGSKQFSHLPIDRIYMIKKVVRENVRFNLFIDFITYIVDFNTYQELGTDKNEKIIKIKDNRIYIQRPIDDEFYILQRLFYFCPKVYYISNSKIKTQLKEKLEKLKKIYDNYK